MHTNRWLWLLGLFGVATACGGRQVTGETSSSDNPTGVGGTIGSGGSLATGGSFGTSGGAGSTGVAGSIPTVIGGMQPRCAFAPSSTPAVTTTAPPAVVQARIERFILGDAKMPPTPTPAQIAPGWAGDTAVQFLDGFAGATSTAPGGFVRWLATWTYDGKAPLSAPRWANAMAGSSATLASLIAAPNLDNAPHGIGYLTDKELLSMRQSIDKRGMMILDKLMCMIVPAPPPGIMLPPPVTMPDVTDRQAHAQQISAPVCASCHRMLDPFGNAFGHFDHGGAYRDRDNGQPVDASGEFNSPSGGTLTFSSIEDLAPQLAESCDVALCVSRSLLRQAIAQDPTSNVDAFTDDDVMTIAGAFADSGFSIRSLVRAIVESPSFLRN